MMIRTRQEGLQCCGRSHGAQGKRKDTRKACYWVIRIHRINPTDRPELQRLPNFNTAIRPEPQRLPNVNTAIRPEPQRLPNVNTTISVNTTIRP
jgi:hypothetical protein